MERRVFISSTIYDLKPEREHVRRLLDGYRGAVRFTTIMSESPDFPLTPTDLSLRHSLDACVHKVALADYCLILLKQRYGAPIISHERRQISITHREYREAYARRVPLFTFVDQRTWDARNAHKRGVKQDFVPAAHAPLFDLIDEIAHQPRSNWMYFYASLGDLTDALTQVLFTFDDSAFVADLTVSDGSVLRVDTSFRKVWEIRNSGCLVWEDRFLQEENPDASGLIPASRRVPIPTTRPGEVAQIAVVFRTPKYPSTCYSYWKMVDASARYCFPLKKGLFCKVSVVY